MIETLFSTGTVYGPIDRAARPRAFVYSAILHCGVISLLCIVLDERPHPSDTPARKYAVNLLDLGSRELKPVLFAPRTAAPDSSVAGASAKASAGRGLSGPAPQGARRAAADQPVAQNRIQLPPPPKVQVVKQTLVQMNAPADVLLTQSIPIPPALIWAEPKPAPKKFIAPVRREVPRPAVNVPDAPTFDLANKEVKVAELKIATARINPSPRLVQPPATPMPVRVLTPTAGDQIPETVRPGPDMPGAGNLISLPQDALLPSGVVVVPPANQIASVHVAPPGNGNGTDSGGGAHANGSGSGLGPGLGTASTPGQGKATAGRGGGSGTSAGNGSGSAGGSGAGASGKADGSGAGGALAGLGGGSSAGNGNGDGYGLYSSSSSSSGKALRPGTKRITQPQNGRFSVVVFGSSATEAYPESAEFLTGKLVYTVYLKVGLRKSWILQYCLPKTVKMVAVKGSAPAIDAPWPFIMIRPDRIGEAPSDYIIVHGFVNSKGKFEQLALVLPSELAEKELLLSSLEDWEFRPATNDGVPTGVEILLIIPRETA